MTMAECPLVLLGVLRQWARLDWKNHPGRPYSDWHQRNLSSPAGAEARC